MIISDTVLDVLSHERYIEYIEWRMKQSISSDPNSSNTTITTKIVVEGANAIYEQYNPIMMKLYTYIHQTISTIVVEWYHTINNKDRTVEHVRNVVLDSDHRSIILKLCNNSTTPTTISTSHQQHVDTNCRIINSFRL